MNANGDSRSNRKASQENPVNYRMPIAALLLGLTTWVCAEEGQWARFRGPNGTGISDAATIPVTWTDKDYNWKVQLPGVGHSSPVVWGKRVFLTSGDPNTAKRMVLCLDAATGRTLWQRDYPSKRFGQHSDNSYATATPAVDAAGVVVAWSTPDEVVLLALDSDGNDVWRRNLGPFVGVHGSGSSPIIVGDLVVLANEQEDPKALPMMYGRPDSPKSAGKSFLIGVDRKTGQTRWQVDRRSSQAAYSTPCLYKAEGGKPELVFSSTSHGITAVDPGTGKVNWEANDLFTERCVCSPVTAPGLVIAGHGFGSRGNHFAAVRPGSQQKDGKPVLAYEIKKPVPLVPTLLVKDGRLYLWADDGLVMCLDVSNGGVIWRQRIGGAFYSSPVCVNDRLYCVARNGDVVVLAASAKYELLGRVPLGESSFATPAVADGVMYLRTRTQLFCLGGKKP
jgi:outer membrane protein assembly factor BamB